MLGAKNKRISDLIPIYRCTRINYIYRMRYELPAADAFARRRERLGETNDRYIYACMDLARATRMRDFVAAICTDELAR